MKQMHDFIYEAAQLSFSSNTTSIIAASLTEEDKDVMAQNIADSFCEDHFDFSKAFCELAHLQDDVSRRRVVYLKKGRLFDPKAEAALSIGYAQTPEDLEAAYCLVHDCYIDTGYIDPHPSGMRIRLYEALPKTVTIIAKNQGKIVATVSLVVDSELGLPMDESFGDEVNALRRQNRCVAEVTGLAVDKSHRDLSVLARLSKYMIAYAIHAGVNDLCIAINPEHADFYTEAVLFESLGSVRSYSSAKEDPVVGLRLNLDTYEKRLWKTYCYADLDLNLYSFFYGVDGVLQMESAKQAAETPRMSPEMLRYFFVEKTNLLRDALPKVRQTLMAFYPGYNFSDILQNKKNSRRSAQPQWSWDFRVPRIPLQIILPHPHPL